MTEADQSNAVLTGELVSSFWKYCSFALGFVLLLSVGANAGPASAAAGEQIGGGGDGVLSIGGFDAVGDEPGFVIVDGMGVRVGVLPMVVGKGE
tara:strand:- start:9976 stop:10257 length:282 start_codon:yes stop_codon:yes gene_type:complete